LNTAPRILIARCAWPLRDALRSSVPASGNAQLWNARLTATGSAPDVEATSDALLLCDLPAGADVSNADAQLWIGELIGNKSQAVPVDAAGMICYFMSIDAQHEEEFNDWYNTEHIPALGAVPGTLCARRYRGTGAAAQRYLAAYYLTSAEIPNSTAWKVAANTPWTERMRPHFRNHLRIVSRRYRRGAS
jgi:hypothetical protein